MKNLYFGIVVVAGFLFFGAGPLQARASCLEGSRCGCYDPFESAAPVEKRGRCFVYTPDRPNGFDVGSHDRDYSACRNYDVYVPGCDAYEERQGRQRELDEAANEEAEERANDNLENCQKGRKKFRRQRNDCRADLAEVRQDLGTARNNAADERQRARESLNACQSNNRETLADVLGQCMAIGNNKQDSLDAACALVSDLAVRLPSTSLQNAEEDTGRSQTSEQWLTDLKRLKRTVCGISGEDIRALVPLVNKQESSKSFKKSNSSGTQHKPSPVLTPPASSKQQQLWKKK